MRTLVTTDAQGRLRYKGRLATWHQPPHPKFGGGTIRVGNEYISVPNKQEQHLIATQIKQQTRPQLAAWHPCSW